MASRTRWIPVVVVALGAACADTSGPTAQPETDNAALSRGTPVTWQGPVAFSAEQTTPDGTVSLAPTYQVSADGAAGSSDYTVSFWAVRGQQRELHIEYTDNGFGDGGAGANADSYLRFWATDPAIRPDGSLIAAGDSVQITVSVNASDMVAHFAPAGLQFGAPSTLRMWYTGAEGDLNGDGSSDMNDVVIEATTLGIYHQADGSEDWDDHPDAVEVTEDRITAPIFHFSGYAVAW